MFVELALDQAWGSWEKKNFDEDQDHAEHSSNKPTIWWIRLDWSWRDSETLAALMQYHQTHEYLI